MTIHNYVVCKDILGIQTNSKYIGWSFGHPSKKVSDEEINRCLLVVRFIIDPLDSESVKLENLEKYHYWRGEYNKDELFYQRNFFVGTKLRLLARGLKNGRSEIKTNKYYLKFIKFRFNNLHSPGYHLTDLVCALLLRKNLCPVHCSGFSINGSTVIVIAPPDTGKTLTTMRAVYDFNASFISEDLGITDGEYFYACPWTSTFRYYDELSMSWLMRKRMKLIKMFPPAEFLPLPGDSKSIENYIEKEQISTHKKITHVAILARRPGDVVEIVDQDRALQMILNVNRYEFVYMKNPLLTAYSYFNPDFDIKAVVAKEQEILTKLVNQSTCLFVQSENPTKFAKLILKEINK